MATLSSYTFLPWIRQGIASRISEKDSLGVNDGTADERAVLKASLEVKHTATDSAEHSSIISKDIGIAGPGDVLNFSRKNIVRTEPANGITNFEANSLAYIEFYEEDFPWRFTPAAADVSVVKQSRLRPWITVIALKNEEFTLKSDPDGLSYISVDQNAFNDAFPHQNDTWAFAHVHLNLNIDTLQGQQLQNYVSQMLRQNPDVAISRLLCARKLQKNTGYTAFVIPSFETGRLAGLGIDISGIKAQAPAWKKGAMPASGKRPFDFPVYHQWSFRTAALGDFESLAAVIQPAVISPESGKMPMDISNPGFGISTGRNGTKTIGMEAALKPPAFNKDSWPGNDGGSVNTDDQNTVNKLKQLLNLSADLIDKNAAPGTVNPFFNTDLGDDPLLVPPVYGVWHAMAYRLGDNTNSAWIESLNLDFRNRAAAGLGRKVVQQHQEDFVTRAWQQVNKVNEANKAIQQAALSTQVNTAILKKHIINGGKDKAIMLTNPVQHLIINPVKKQTVQQDFIDSRIPVAAKSPAFRRITRPYGRTPEAGFFSVPVKTASKAATFNLTANNLVSNAAAAGSIFQRFNADPSAPGALTAAKLKAAPSGALQINSMDQSMNAVMSQYVNSIPNLAKDQFVKLIDANVGTTPVTKAQLAQLANNMSVSLPAVKTALLDLVNNIAVSAIQKSGGQTIVQLNDVKFKNVFGEAVHAKRYDDIIVKDSAPLNKDEVENLTTLSDIANFQMSFTQFAGKIIGLPFPGISQPFSQIDAVSDYIFNRINPVVTLTKKLASTIKVYQAGQYSPLEKLKPVMAYPEFTESVYTYLLKLSKNYILPNIDKLPNNSIALLENNQSFVEAFMVGLNHEMARELLWREFPTDQRGSYFRQFWSIKDNLFMDDEDPALDKEAKLDIKKIHEWSGKLGQHSPRIVKNHIVIVIRGELMKKFPNTMVYAQQAAYDSTDPSKPRKLKGGISSTQTKFPLFKAEIDPDITLLGFDLQPEEARGEKIANKNTSTAGKNAGWFFVMKERPGQVRFGLDNYVDANGDDTVMPANLPSTWNDLAWEHLVGKKDDLQHYHLGFNKSVNIANAVNQPVWASNSADMASILFQNPVLFARHAAEMLPG